MIKLLDIIEEGTLTLTPEERQQVEDLLPVIIDNIKRPIPDNFGDVWECGEITYTYADGEIGKTQVAVGHIQDTARAYFNAYDRNNRTDNWIVINQKAFKPYFPSSTFQNLDQKFTNTITGNENTGIERLRQVLKHELIHAKDPALNHHFSNTPYQTPDKDESIYYKTWAEFQTFTGQFFESLISGTDRVLRGTNTASDVKRVEKVLSNILRYFAGKDKTINLETKEFIDGTGSRNIFQKIFNFIKQIIRMPSDSDYAMSEYIYFLSKIKQYNPEGYKEFLKDLYKTIKTIEEKVNSTSPLKIKVQENKTRLSLDEKKAIAKFILKKNKVKTLQEAKNNDLYNEINQNIQFYSGLKEHLSKNKALQEGLRTGIGWIDNIIGFFGSIKDLLTSTSLGKWLTEKIRKWLDGKFPKLSQNPNDTSDKIAKFFGTVSKWLGPSGISYLIAAWKQKSFKPGKEAIEAAKPMAEKIYKVILGILIAIAITKLIMFLSPFAPAVLKGFSAFAGASNVTTGTINAGMVAGPLLLKALSAAGLKGVAAGAFNIVGLTQKIQHLKGHDAEHEAEDAANQELAKAPAEIDAAVG
jgi:hypothetical protein